MAISGSVITETGQWAALERDGIIVCLKHSLPTSTSQLIFIVLFGLLKKQLVVVVYTPFP